MNDILKPNQNGQKALAESIKDNLEKPSIGRVAFSSFSGPIPSPDFLKQYEN